MNAYHTITTTTMLFYKPQSMSITNATWTTTDGQRN